MDESVKSFFNKKNILTLLVIGVMILAIPVAVRLIQQQQQLKSKAAGEPIIFTGPNVSKDSSGQFVTTDPTVQVELRSPLGPPVGSQ